MVITTVCAGSTIARRREDCVTCLDVGCLDVGCLNVGCVNVGCVNVGRVDDVDCVDDVDFAEVGFMAMRIRHR